MTPCFLSLLWVIGVFNLHSIPLALSVHLYLSRGDDVALTIGQYINLQHSPACLPTSANIFYDASKTVTRARRPCNGTSRNKPIKPQVTAPLVRHAKFTGGMKNLWQGSQSRLASLTLIHCSISHHTAQNFFFKNKKQKRIWNLSGLSSTTVLMRS